MTRAPTSTPSSAAAAATPPPTPVPSAAGLLLRDAVDAAAAVEQRARVHRDDAAPRVDVREQRRGLRVALVAERGAQVRLEFTEGGLLLSAGGDDAGRAEESLAAEFQGEPLIIAFNPGYLLDGLGSLHSEKVSFGFTTGF